MESKKSKDKSEIVTSSSSESKMVQMLRQELTYSGPLPPASQLEKYNQIAPGAAKKIVQHMMSEQEHRHEIDRKSLELEIKEAFRGQWMGFFVTITAFLSALFCVYLGAYWVAAVCLASPIAGIVQKFIPNSKR